MISNDQIKNAAIGYYAGMAEEHRELKEEAWAKGAIWYRGQVGKIPHKCPICGGKGSVSHSFYNTNGAGSTSSISDVTCRTCGGGAVLWESTPPK